MHPTVRRKHAERRKKSIGTKRYYFSLCIAFLITALVATSLLFAASRAKNDSLLSVALAPVRMQTPGRRTEAVRAEIACGRLQHPSEQVENNGNFTVTCETTQGDVSITMHRTWAPLGHDRFLELVRDHFFDDQILYRTLPGFLVQFGVAADPIVHARGPTKGYGMTHSITSRFLLALCLSPGVARILAPRTFLCRWIQMAGL